MILRTVKAKYRVSKDCGFLDHLLYIHGQLKYMKKSHILNFGHIDIEVNIIFAEE